MLGLLTVTAVVLLVPTLAAVLAVEPHRHVSPGDDSRRWVRLVLAATGVALVGLGTAALVGADVLSAAVVALVLAGSVLIWGPLTRSWAVRGVVLWSLLVVAAAGLLGWLVQQVVTSALSGAQIGVVVAATALLLGVLVRGQGYARDAINARAGLGAHTAVRPRLPVLRPLVALVVLMAAGGGVLAMTSESTGPDRGGPPLAGGTGLASDLPQPSTATTPTVASSPHVSGARTPRFGMPAGHDAARSSRRPEAVLRPLPVIEMTMRALAMATAPVTRSAAPAAHAVTRPAPRHHERPSAADPKPPAPRPASPPEPPAPPVTSPPPVPGPVRPARTPGYAKPRPNRPSGAPSPGHGRAHHHPAPPLPPRSLTPTGLPSLTP